MVKKCLKRADAFRVADWLRSHVHTLTQHTYKVLARDAGAELNLDISRTTIERICRDLGIEAGKKSMARPHDNGCDCGKRLDQIDAAIKLLALSIVEVAEVKGKPRPYLGGLANLADLAPFAPGL